MKSIKIRRHGICTGRIFSRGFENYIEPRFYFCPHFNTTTDKMMIFLYFGYWYIQWDRRPWILQTK